MSDKPKVLRLDTLANKVAGQVDVGGKLHDVLQLSLRRQQRILAPKEGDDIDAVLENVRVAVPTLSDGEIDGLNFDQTQAILALSSANIDAVERLFPNAVSPEQAPTSPG